MDGMLDTEKESNSVIETLEEKKTEVKRNSRPPREHDGADREVL